MLKALVFSGTVAILLAGCATPAAVDGAKTPVARTPATCLTTGTRIALKPGECVQSPGRAYSKDDIERTGAIDTAEALRMLDPSLR